MRSHPSPDTRWRSGGALYRVTHDLNASARAIAQLSDWIIDDLAEAGLTLPQCAVGNLGLLKNRAQRLQSMLADLAIYENLGRGDCVFDGDWDALIGSILEEVPNSKQFKIVKSLVAVPTINLDDLQFVVGALLTNAIKHHDRTEGYILISCRQAANGATRLCVEDDGPGIPEDRHAEARQVMTVLQPRDITEGSGMGLAICSRVAEIYGGDVSIDIGPNGRGTRLSVVFNGATTQSIARNQMHDAS